MRGMLKGCLLVFSAFGFLSGRTWAAGAMANAGSLIQAKSLHAHILIEWRLTLGWALYKSFLSPVEIPPTILEYYRTQA